MDEIETHNILGASLLAMRRAVEGLAQMPHLCLVDGNQNHEKARGALVYGQSITDKCMSWERTEPLFTELAEAVRKRRR